MSKAVLVIDQPEYCPECPLYSEDDYGFGCGYGTRENRRQMNVNDTIPAWCPLKPLNKIVKAGDRNLIIYERAWLYSHLEEEFEMQKKVRDWEKQNESSISDRSR